MTDLRGTNGGNAVGTRRGPIRVGVIVPQGWTGEYAGWDARKAWSRTVELAQRAETLGFESIWVYDHFHTTPEPTDEMTFEAYTTLSALATLTERIRLGQVVTCAAYRNPALLAKMISTLDVVSGGRVELGIGAGWKRDEWLAYGYEFPETKERLARLDDDLAVIEAMFEEGRATVDRPRARVEGAINLPAPIQRPRPPIVVGGNGRDITWRIAARHADELNLDAMPADELPEAMRVIAERCEEIGRDPTTLRVSVHLWWEHLEPPAARADLIAAYADAGVSRVMTLVRSAVDDPASLDAFAEDARRAGVALGGITAPA